MSLPFLAKKPLDIPPIVSVELIQIAEKTNIPFAPKAKKIIEKVKEKEKKLVSEQAPPKKVEKTKTKTVLAPDQNNKKIENETPEAIPLPDKTLKKVETKEEKKQNPEKYCAQTKIASLAGGVSATYFCPRYIEGEYHPAALCPECRRPIGAPFRAPS